MSSHKKCIGGWGEGRIHFLYTHIRAHYTNIFFFGAYRKGGLCDSAVALYAHKKWNPLLLVEILRHYDARSVYNK